MARQRNYAAEYARRVQTARQRAAAESRPFSLAQARGHKSREHESTQRRVNKLARDLQVPKDELKKAIQAHGWQAVKERLEDKERTTNAYLRGESGPGHDEWEHADRDDWPDVFYWYHAAFGG